MALWQSLPRSKRPPSQSYLTILCTTKDPLILLKVHFYSYIAVTLIPFLAEYQYVKAMMPFIYVHLHLLLRNVVSKYIRPETLEKCKNASMFCDVNFSDAKNHLKSKEVYCCESNSYRTYMIQASKSLFLKKKPTRIYAI